jgi:hypothetical protein
MVMRQTEDLFELRAERISLLSQLNNSSNARRQLLNKRLMAVSKKIQKICGISVASPKGAGEEG